MAVIIAGRRRRRLGRHPPRADRRASQPGAGTLRDQLRIVGAGARLPGPADHLRAPGAGDRLHARRRRLPGRRRARAGRRGDDPLRLLRRAGAAADARCGRAVGTRIGKKPGYVAPRSILAAGALLAVTAQVAPPAVVFAATALVGVGYAGCQVFPMAMLPDAAAVDAAPHRREPRRRLHRRLDRRRDPRPGARARRLRGRARDRRLPLLDRRRRRPARLGAHRDHPRLLGPARGADPAQPVVAAAGTPSTPPR